MIQTTFDKWAATWLGQTVEFTLLGQTCQGVVNEALDTLCTRNYLVVEFDDGVKTIKVGASSRCFRRIPKDAPRTRRRQSSYKLRVIPRRPLNAAEPNGYLESDRDFILNNLDLAVQLLEREVNNHA